MDELTSKQSPIDVTVKADRCDATRAEMIVDAIADAVKNAAPSAQPERCEDCEKFSKTRLLIPQPEPYKEEPKKCDTCKHEKSRWFSRCADCSDYALWEKKE